MHIRHLLLASVSLLASPALAQQAAPTIEIGGGIDDSEFLGSLDLFVPLVQDADRILFGGVRLTGRDNFDFQGSLGLGYRQHVGSGWVLGANAFYDYFDSRFDNTFHQVSLGLEALHPDWEARANVYLPFSGRHGAVEEANAAFLDGDALIFRAGRETSLTGVDGELGARVPVFATDSGLQLKAFAGGYYFEQDDIADERTGVTGRLELALSNLPDLFEDSTLTFAASVRHDDEEGTSGTFLARLRVPLGASGSPSPDAYGSTLNRRVERGGVMTSIGATGAAEAAVFADTGNAVGTVARIGSGDSASAINAELIGVGENGLILANGAIAVNDTVALQEGQRLVGGGGSVAIVGANSGGAASFRVDGAAAAFTGTNASADVFEMADRSVIDTVSITGGRSGIAANGVDGFSIRNADITATGLRGIEMYDVEGATIENVNITGLNDDEGTFSYSDPEIDYASIYAIGARDLTIRNAVLDGARTGLFVASAWDPADFPTMDEPSIYSENIKVENLTVTNTTGEAVFLIGARDLEFENVSLLNAETPGYELDQFVVLSTTDVAVRDMTIRGGSNGIMVVSPLANVSERLSFTDVDIANPGRAGIFLNPNSTNIEFTNVTITDAGTTGIAMLGMPDWGWGSQAVSNISFDNVRIQGGGDGGIALDGAVENLNGNVVMSGTSPACLVGGLMGSADLSQAPGNAFSVNGTPVAAGPVVCP